MRGRGPEFSVDAAPVLAPPVAMVGSPIVLGEIADRIPRRYGGRTLLDLVLLLIPVVGLISGAATLYWMVAWYRDWRQRTRRRHLEARFAAARRRAVAAASFQETASRR